jgi:hypothetical protein
MTPERWAQSSSCFTRHWSVTRNAGQRTWQAGDGTDAAERLTTSSNMQFSTGIAPDGTAVVFHGVTPTQGPRSAAPRARRQPSRDAAPADEIRRARPDCLARRPLAGVRVEQLRPLRDYVRPSPNAGGGQWQVSTACCMRPLWARSGKELFYLAPGGALLRVPVEAGGSTWNAGTPTKLLEGRYYTAGGGTVAGRHYGVSADGQRFLMIKAPGADATVTPPGLIVVQHWDEELKRLVPTR